MDAKELPFHCEGQSGHCRILPQRSVGFDVENKRLIKTYLRGTNLEPPREYLQLDDPPPLTKPDGEKA
ncbi:MAG: hypothetical protein AB7E05_13945 [Sphingobium sp.]